MTKYRSVFILLLICIVQIDAVSLKWLGQGQHYRNLGTTEFHPERDSVQIQVQVENEPSEIIINNSTFPIDSKNTFSLLDLLAKGKTSQRHFSHESSKIQNIKGNSKCGEDIPEWGIYHRIFNRTGKCYVPGKGVSPCGKNMRFYLIGGDDTYGDCDCKMYAGPTHRPLTYWPPTEQCYTLFEQGPCAIDEWLALDESSSPACQKRLCLETSEASKAWFVQNGECYKLSTQAFCAGQNETAQYNFGDLEPKCYDFQIKTKRTMLNSLHQLPCKVGHKNYGSENCKSGTQIH